MLASSQPDSAADTDTPERQIASEGQALVSECLLGGLPGHLVGHFGEQEPELDGSLFCSNRTVMFFLGGGDQTQDQQELQLPAWSATQWHLKGATWCSHFSYKILRTTDSSLAPDKPQAPLPQDA